MQKLIGGTLLLIGTCIGGGMLALPIVTAQAGIYNAIWLLIVVWAITTVSAFYILEANLWFPNVTNLITMSGKSLGPWGQIIAWLSTLLLLYSGLAAYISAGAGVLQHVLSSAHFSLPLSLNNFIFTLVFGYIVYLGVKACDLVNRLFMLLKFITLFIFIALLLPQAQSTNYVFRNSGYLLLAITPVVTSFAYAMIIPTLSCYLNHDLKKMKRIILLGSLLPLVIYLLWTFTILGSLPTQGAHGLIAIAKSNNPVNALLVGLTAQTKYTSITVLSDIFVSVCVITSFLGVALCLTDFLADGIGVRKKGWGNFFIILLTVLPPLIIILIYPNAFIAGLSYAGIFATVLLILLPAMMVWGGRYHKKIGQHYRVWGGKPLLALIVLSAICFLSLGIYQKVS